MRVKRAIITVATVAAGSMLGGQVASATASPFHPTGSYTRFADCPLAAVPMETCLYATIEAGTLTVGRKSIPVSAPLLLQGGFYLSDTEGVKFVGAQDGETLPGAQLAVPGGLTSLVSPQSLPASLQAQLRSSPPAVTMTLQLARNASTIQMSTENFLFGEGIALQLPLKVKLSNPFLGEDCYVGSSSNPIVLSTTTGTTSPPAPNHPLDGTAGTLKLLDETRLMRITGAVLVDNSFAAPQASGCGGANAAVVDRLLDSTIGLPASAGHNSAVLHSTLYLGSSEAVMESE